MNNETNEKGIDRAKIFETVLASPGMQQTCKIALNPTRQTLLILARLVENAGTHKEANVAGEWLDFLPQTAIDELKALAEELLKKGGLVSFYEHLKQL